MRDRYRVILPDGGRQWMLEHEAGASISEAYADVAAHVGCEVCQLSLLVRNHPSSALPFFHLRPSEEPLRKVAPSGSVLIAECSAVDGAAGAVASPRDDGQSLGRAPEWLREASGSATGSTPPAVFAAAAGGDAATSSTPAAEARSPERCGLTGLCNFGNTCYLSSAVQCLSQTRALTEPLLAGGGPAAGGGTVAPAYLGVLRHLWSAGSEEPLVPRALKAALAGRVQTFEGSGQQDAQELIQVLLEALHEDLRRQPAPPAPLELAGVAESDTSPESRSLSAWRQALAADASLVSDLFQGQLRSTVRCGECGRADVAFELFWSLQVPVPQPVAAEASPSLADALGAFCAEEPLGAEGDAPDWCCGHCGRPTRGSNKRLELWRLPPVLQLHLKRFKWEKPAATRPASKQGTSVAAAPSPEAGAALPPVPVGGAHSSGAAAAAATEGTTAATLDEPGVAAASSGQAGATAAHSAAAVADATIPAASAAVSAEDAPRQISMLVPWAEQERMYGLVLRLLARIAEDPDNPKFRSVGKEAAKLRRDLLDLPGGAALLQWAGFQDVGGRFEAGPGLTAAAAEDRRGELQAHAERAQMRHLRRERDERIEQERQRRLPRGDGAPIRRWGGRLPSFGRGPEAAYGLVCTKVEVRLALAPEPMRRRGFSPLYLGKCLGSGSPCPGGAAEYELYAVVQHLGPSPYSGHYVATCWHEASGAWWRFNDSNVSRVPTAQLTAEVFGGGSYVLFLECTGANEAAESDAAQDSDMAQVVSV